MTDGKARSRLAVTAENLLPAAPGCRKSGSPGFQNATETGIMQGTGSRKTCHERRTVISTRETLKERSQEETRRMQAKKEKKLRRQKEE